MNDDIGVNIRQDVLRTRFVSFQVFFLTCMLINISDVHFYSHLHAQQTRDQCYGCCAGAGYDEYFTEQCRLKCFRNPDHCIPAKGKESVAGTQPPAPVEKPPRQKPVEQPQVAAQEQPARPQPRRADFVWPNPLNLSPGREFEAAGQILAMNGIVPQHPNYAVALRAVADMLTDFGRNNPMGGALPTAQLERLVGQFR
jgi:hypothetical protein